MAGYDDVLAEAETHGIAFRRLKELREPLCREMLAYWKEVRGDRAMPRPDEINPVRFARHMPNLLMVQVNWEPFDLTYRLLGGDVVNAHGSNFRGRRVLDSQSHTGRFSEVLYSFYKFVAEEERPYAVAGTMEYVARGFVSVEAVYLPLSLDGKRTDRILGATVSKELPGRGN
ncbi:PAS domain-containing protein [Parvibaculum sp.]|uniref:PAS domain-containing protein n=1 Tax=Parvibaculum sp. TaxID=2024848 RepID=UPI001B045FFF|nr:PAS domain-containing protein [Parvibaculum sp.]MBO6634464.1 PAS domain-containing protein [Parvibaculum sp.]MBO6686217.1 PAS domain-containing protein [Parvibaculum sp.]